MSHLPPIVPDKDRLYELLGHTQQHGKPISRETARELATWFSEGISTGFETFLATGVVSGHLYAELVRLHDLRTDEAGQWLANLTRFVLAQPVLTSRRRSTKPSRRSEP